MTHVVSDFSFPPFLVSIVTVVMTILTAITSLTLLLVMMVVPSRCVNRPPECYANPPSGSCDGSPSVMYYYDGYPLKQCRNFTYTDCPYVLKNIFETLEECRQICIEGTCNSNACMYVCTVELNLRTKDTLGPI